MLPVDKEHDGSVIAPIVGAFGIMEGGILITTLAVGAELHPNEFVATKLYVPDESPEIIVLKPVPA